jgi:hypothetical protein
LWRALTLASLSRSTVNLENSFLDFSFIAQLCWETAALLRQSLYNLHRHSMRTHRERYRSSSAASQCHLPRTRVPRMRQATILQTKQLDRLIVLEPPSLWPDRGEPCEQTVPLTDSAMDANDVRQAKSHRVAIRMTGINQDQHMHDFLGSSIWFSKRIAELELGRGETSPVSTVKTELSHWTSMTAAGRPPIPSINARMVLTDLQISQLPDSFPTSSATAIPPSCCSTHHFFSTLLTHLCSVAIRLTTLPSKI